MNKTTYFKKMLRVTDQYFEDLFDQLVIKYFKESKDTVKFVNAKDIKV